MLDEIAASEMGLTPGQVAKRLKLSRPAAYRAVASLQARGYVQRMAASGRYVLARAALQRLAGRKIDDARAATVDKVIRDLCEDVLWPVSVAGPAGVRMVVWATTDAETSLTLDRFGSGFDVPMLESASGRAYLAHLPAPQQAGLIGRLAASDEPFAELARDATRLGVVLRDARRLGYVMTTHEPWARPVRRRARRAAQAPRGRTTSMSVPILVAGAPIGCLALRYFDTALSRAKAAQRYLRKLQDAAARIAAAWNDAGT